MIKERKTMYIPREGRNQRKGVKYANLGVSE